MKNTDDKSKNKKKKKFKKPVLVTKKIVQSEVVVFGTYGYWGPQFGS